MPEVLNDEHTKFRIKIRPGVFWSDGVEFTTDDLIYTLDIIFKYRDKWTFIGATLQPQHLSSEGSVTVTKGSVIVTPLSETGADTPEAAVCA